MTAHSAMNSQQFPFLHGSDQVFVPGDLITSSMARGTEPRTASATAKSAHTRAYPGTPYSSPRRANNFFTTVPDHAEMFGRHVYEVEPTGRVSEDKHDSRMKYFSGDDPEHFRSRAPLRVVRHVSSSEYEGVT